LLDDWLKRPRRDRIVDLRGVVPACGAQACQPIPVPLRPPTDFLWQRNPFQLAGGLHGTIEGAGIDYILPYWMARYHGLTRGFAVTSSAAAGVAVAPESIASAYGSGLAAATSQAMAQPLPTALGGVTVRIRDAAGVERDAPLLYVSPSQINFVVPAGIAPGPATLTAVNGTANPPTAAVNIETVAPALFTMLGNGTGVAAATAIRIPAGNPGQQTPVPVFRCDQGPCVSVPVELAAGAEVYLTLYGTGIRRRVLLADVSVTINGVSVPVLYAGAQPDFLGLDQVNVALPLSLRGAGETDVVLRVSGRLANTVRVNVR
jgi:uncharacterized protein (TIGR03437 family)